MWQALARRALAAAPVSPLLGAAYLDLLGEASIYRHAIKIDIGAVLVWDLRWGGALPAR